MKIRITEIVENNSQPRYYPEYQNFLGFWCRFYDDSCIDGISVVKTFSTLQNAVDWLDKYLHNNKINYIKHHKYSE